MEETLTMGLYLSPARLKEPELITRYRSLKVAQLVLPLNAFTSYVTTGLRPSQVVCCANV